MRNCEYRLNGRVSRRELSECAVDEEQSRLEEQLRRLGVPDAGINYVLGHPSVIPVIYRAIHIVQANPELPFKEAFIHCISTKQPEDDGYGDSMLASRIRTWGNFVPIELPPGDREPIPFSALSGKYREEVNCRVLGKHRDSVSSSSHYYEHAFERYGP